MADADSTKETTAAAEPPAAPAAEAAAPAAAKPADGKTDEEESTQYFEPVVKLEEVEVENGEEEEECTFKQRARLFKYGESMLDVGTGTKKWNDRGTGDVRLLKHKEFGKIRLLMRQDKTMKVVVTHLVNPDTELAPNVGSDRSWVWSACDFSLGEIDDAVFAIRFRNTDEAKTFKEAYDGARGEMKTIVDGGDAGDTSKGDEAADA